MLHSYSAPNNDMTTAPEYTQLVCALFGLIQVDYKFPHHPSTATLGRSSPALRIVGVNWGPHHHRSFSALHQSSGALLQSYIEIYKLHHVCYFTFIEIPRNPDYLTHTYLRQHFFIWRTFAKSTFVHIAS